MEPLLQKYFDLMERNKLLTWQMLGSLDESLFHWKQREQTWSLAQVLEHVIFSEASALAYCKKKMLAGDDIPEATWINSLKVRLYFWALESKLKFKAPKPIANPDNGKSISEMKEYWNHTRADYVRFLEDYPERYLSKAIFRHPLAGRIRLSEMLYFLQVHIVHHQYQITRIIDSSKDL